MRLLEAQETGKANTPPTPIETILDDPVSVAGHAGDGGADASMLAISKTGGCDLGTPPEGGTIVPRICRAKESLLGQE